MQKTYVIATLHLEAARGAHDAEDVLRLHLGGDGLGLGALRRVHDREHALARVLLHVLESGLRRVSLLGLGAEVFLTWLLKKIEKVPKVSLYSLPI